MEEEIADLLREAGRRHTAKVILLRAAGKVFCSGHDRKEVLDTSVSDIRRLFQASMNLMLGIYLGYNCSTPTVAVSRCVGQKKCMEMLMTGNLYPAHEAKEMGLVNRVVPDERLEEETWNFAKEISQYSRKILALSKQVYYGQSEMTEWQAYHYTKEVMTMNAVMPPSRGSRRI